MSAATATPPTSATMPNFPPSSPSKQDLALKPNPHPYAIKTTSTALLSRSTSSGHVTPSHYFYVPPARTASRSPTKSKSEYRGHRYSTSLTGELPSPLPVPASPTHSQRSQSEDGASVGSSPTRRTKRAETLPSGYPEALEALTDGLGILGAEDLPSNPKLWTPSQLSVYLMTALRVRSGETMSVPALVARDITNWVRKEGIGGRTFLRWGDEDLEGYGINTLWRNALLNASRNLRQNVLRGRIWGTPTSPTSPTSEQPPASHPFSSEMYASSSSSLDLSLSDSGGPAISPLRRGNAIRVRKSRANGRVKGMVDKWERESAGSGSAYGSESEHEVDDERRESITRSPEKVEGELLLAEQRPSAEAEERELSMEELLASVSAPEIKEGSWGARAWEEMDLGVTVKRIGESQSWDTVVKRPDTSRNGTGNAKKFDTGKRGSSSRVKTGPKDERRVVTAIFAPPVEEPEPRPVAEDVVDPIVDSAQELAAEERVRELERRLEQDVRGTRELLEEFRHRLEEVETRVAEMEERERQQATAALSEQSEKAAADERLVEEKATTTDDFNDSYSKLVATNGEYPVAAAPSSLVSRAFAYASPAEHEDGPTNMSDLPSYVLLVGLGVCAVVFKVVLKRVAGRNLKA
ncbi:hypothetical protein BV25DRAFT_1822709 [Artomyces pyxidatus]|uniref:Uncharacterized protein n=1 Tax=Artomyces pyxidatus TaxID=48021 RepID=A0ACB8T9S4_9AGAM|nr:hypothetical protein BV25DRAFT_1822709 [Artomyces pyxidatus]